MKFKIVQRAVNTRSGENDRGKWEMHEQEAYVFTGREFPMLCKITLPKERGNTPYPEGDYELDLSKSVEVGSYGRLQFGREIHLNPVSASSDTGRGSATAAAARV